MNRRRAACGERRKRGWTKVLALALCLIPLSASAQPVAPDLTLDPTRSAARQTWASEMYFQGIRYLKGEGVEQSITQATNWFHKAATLGNAEAQYNLGLILASSPGASPASLAAAAHWYEEAARQGMNQAKNNLGVLLSEGKGGERDPRRAAALFREAAAANLAAAQYNLGLAYENGQGLEQDYGAATHWYQRAADQGHAAALYMLGLLRAHGRGGTPDAKEGVRLFRRGAEMGLAAAQAALASAYEQGEGVGRDLKEAFRWFQTAAEQGDGTAQTSLGRFHAQGLVNKTNLLEACYWWGLAAKQGNKEARIYAENAERHLTPSQIQAIRSRVEAWAAQQARPGGELESLLSGQHAPPLRAARSVPLEVGSSPPAPASAAANPRRPRTINEALAIRAAREPTADTPGLSGSVKSALTDLLGNAIPFPKYEADMLGAVNARVKQLWPDSPLRDKGLDAVLDDRVAIGFRLHADGQLSNVRLVDLRMRDNVAAFYLRALLDTSPWTAWTPEMRSLAKAEYLDLLLTFSRNDGTGSGKASKQ